MMLILSLYNYNYQIIIIGYYKKWNAWGCIMTVLFSISHLCLSATFHILFCLALCKRVLNTIEHINGTPSQVGFHLGSARGNHQQQGRKAEEREAGCFLSSSFLSLVLSLANNGPIKTRVLCSIAFVSITSPSLNVVLPQKVYKD